MQMFGFEIIFEGANFSRLVDGLLVTAYISIISLIVGLALGVFIGILRTLNNKILDFIFRFYLEIFRIIPLIVLLFVAYYYAAENFGVNFTKFEVAVIVFVLWISSEMSDLVRAAIINVPKLQIESGKVLGFNRLQLYEYVLIPQSFPYALPAIINLITRVIKTTSLLSLIGVMEIIKVGQEIIGHYTLTVPTVSFWIYLTILILYFLLCYPLSYYSKKLELRLATEKETDFAK